MKRFLFISLCLFLFMSCEKLIRWEYKMKGVAEEGRREVFEKSRAYNVGAEQELADYYGQYQLANDEDKIIIKSTIQMAFSSYDEEMIRQDKLRKFLKEMKYGSEF